MEVLADSAHDDVSLVTETVFQEVSVEVVIGVNTGAKVHWTCHDLVPLQVLI